MAAKISLQDKRARLDWKDIFKHRYSACEANSFAELAAQANKFISDSGRSITGTQVSHYIAKPESSDLEALESKDLRVPNDKWVCNALVWALDELGAWGGMEEAEKEVEQNQLRRLLGFEILDQPVMPMETGLEPVKRMFEAFQEMAESAPNDQLIVYVWSSTGFFAGKSQEAIEPILDCARANIQVVYMIGSDWAETRPPVRNVVRSLKNGLAAALSSNEEAMRLSPYLGYVELPERSPSLLSLLVRAGCLISVSKLRDVENIERELMQISHARKGAHHLERLWVEYGAGEDSHSSDARWYEPEPSSCDVYMAEVLDLLNGLKASNCEIQSLIDGDI